MADRNSVADWDTNPNGNDNIGGTNIAEGCAPSGMNDAVRKVMAQAKVKFDSLTDDIAKSVPAGAVLHFARNTPPTGWLKANGAAVSRTTYAALFAALGTTFGAGDGTTTFNLPDLRGEFIRGWDDGRGVDSGRAFGSAQADQNKSHTHTASTASDGAHVHTGTADSAGAHVHSASAASAGSHAHSGSALSAGAHTHTFPASGASGTATGPNIQSVSNAQVFTTNSAGAHTHTLSINAAGDHTHTITVNSAGAHTHGLTINSAGAHTHAVTVVADGGTEARPRNIALLACIKF